MGDSCGRRVSRAASRVSTALLPRYDVEWFAEDECHVGARYKIDGRPFTLSLSIDDVGHVTSVTFDRWGDPDETGIWQKLPPGGDIDEHATFGGLTIPSAGRLGWFYDTIRWPKSEFFRFNVNGLNPV
jgi:hypothetical protein